MSELDPLGEQRRFPDRTGTSTAPTRLRIGIGGTLSIAFVAVAILAAAANLISERGLDVVAASDALPAAETFVVSLPAVPVSSTLPADEPRATQDTSTLLPTLDEFDRIVQRRVLEKSPVTDSLLRKAAKALQTERDHLLSHAKERDGERAGRIFGAVIQTHISDGLELVRLADETRSLLTDYAARYNTMRARARSSIDHAWTLFGRVVARQSLLTLNRQIEELGGLSVGLGLVGGSDAANSAAITTSERAIAGTLVENERGLTSSQGSEWLTAMNDDLAYLSSTHATLLETLDRQRELQDRFASIRTQLDSSPSAPLDRNAAQPKAVAPPAQISASAPGPQPATPVAHTTYERSAIIAWVSAGVLLLLVIISAATVRSVVGPVRRLVTATDRLADGEMDVRVRAGGIKELDTLATAFNSMAERLALAERAKREYQQQLEAKVEERTEQLRHLASNDPLTSLPNHRQLFVLLNEALARAASTGTMAGVYFLDIDNFKNINDGMGHAYGDKVLKAMAQRLQEVASEFGFAARLGGDEFTVVIDRATTFEEICDAGTKLVRVFHAPLNIDNRDLSLSVSVGASVFPDHGRTAEALLRAADAALFRAKALGRSQLSIYSPELLEAASAKFAVEQGLRRALEKGDFELVFQPEFNLESLDVELVEALIRWRQPDGSLASPGDFLAVAEESGLIMDISDWVLRSAVETAARWHHGSWPHACVAVNVSSRHLIDSHFVERVKSLLSEYRLPPRCIEIELTETVLQTGSVTLEALRQLRAHGIAIALDDFGTGYSSLSSLQQLPLTRIKLDRSLVNDIDTSARALAIARSIIGLARSLGLQITAEGIERPEQLALLLREGTMCVQGFLFSRPLAQGDLIAALPTVEQRSRALLPPALVQHARQRYRSTEPHGQIVSALDRLPHRIAVNPAPPRI